MDRQVFRHQLNSLHRWQGHQRRQGRTEIMCRQTKLAGVGWQAILVARRMLDGVRPRRQLCEEEDGNEKEAAHLKHRVSLAGQHYAWMAKLRSVSLDQQTLQILAFREIQRHRMIGRPGQATNDARIAPGIERRIGDDFLEHFQPDATGTRIGHQ